MPTLFINQNGMVTCARHGGAYLQTYLKHHPGAQVVDTPLDNWERISEDVAETLRGCETALFDPDGLRGECE